MIFATGCIPEDDGLNPHVRELVAVGAPSLGRPSKFIDRVLNQGAIGMCVGAAFAQGVYLRAACTGINIAFPSPLAIYTLARHGQNPLTDSGSQPAAAVDGMRSYGLCSEERWPFDPMKANVGLPWDVLQHDIDARIDGCFELDGDDVEQIKQCIDNGIPVAFAQIVDHHFDNYEEGTYLDEFDGFSRGWHYTLIVNYDDTGVHCLNSWGDGWGDKGFYRATWNRLASPQCRNFRAVSVAPGAVS